MRTSTKIVHIKKDKENKKDWAEMKKRITEVKNTLERINSRLNEAKD